MLGSSSVENKLLDDPGGHNSSSISCSICLDAVTDNGDRSTAKLQCGHEFHLDCIGSAFNVKGAMQCPNCRKIERGRWLYATGPARSLPEFHIEDWTVDEDPYELSYTEMPFRVHWCPFSGFTQVHSSFEDIDSPSAAYHDLQRYRAEHDPASSVAHSYVAYFGPLPPPPPPLASSNTNEIREDPNLNNSWSGLSERNEIFNPHHPLFPIVDIQYQSWDQLPPTIPLSSTSNSDQAAEVRRTARGEFRHPFPYGHGTAPGVGGSGASLFSSFVHPTIHGRGAAHERRQYVSHASINHHQQQPNNPPLRRLNNSQRGGGSMPLVMAAAAAQPDNHGRGFFLVPSPVSHETENNNNSNNPSLHHHHIHHHHHPWDRDSFSRMPVISFERDPAVRGSFHRGGGFVSGSRTGGGGGGGFWQRHWP
ncbi:E3 ubiquitin-protein ligase RFI2 [Impatiens glandulifera]|uniref:E3 ubiquitin-protein ligase RFI2 n=1 Tax=Impatiens glandulifera TaxID=253017 RepID=UPI001FB19519|nr:E3 ubiquitin-protein ligase RFI2 [Impatiens glandulifera]